MLREVVQAEEATQGGFAHGFHVAKAHVVGDEGHDLVGVFIAEAETVEDGARDGSTDLGMAVEADARLVVAGLRRTVAGRFAHVVKQRGPGESGFHAGFELVEQKEGVDVDVAFGVPVGWLFDPVHAADFREDMS